MSPPKELYPLIAVDVALFCVHGDGLRVLLVKRAREPEIRRWALPGGVLKPDIDKCLEDAARRLLRSKVAVDIPHLEQLHAFSGPVRDPRGWSIGVLFCALLPRDQINAVVRDKVEAVEWVDPFKPGHILAFDHGKQMSIALEALRQRVAQHVLPLHLMAELFTLTALQKTIEAILGHPLEKSAFRRRIKGSPDLIATDEYERGVQRPAQLYSAREGFSF